MAGKNQSSAGPQSWGFLATGPTQPVALAASSVTVTLTQFVPTSRNAPQAAFWSIGAAAANSVAYVNFGTSVTASPTSGPVIVPLGAVGPGSGARAPQILSTGRSPTNVLTIGSAGTTTVWITPGEGSK